MLACLKIRAVPLGPLPEDVIERAHDAGVPVAGLVGYVDQARAQVAAGVDIVIAQGTEAAGHTGTVESMVLCPEVEETVAPGPGAGGRRGGERPADGRRPGPRRGRRRTGSIWLTPRTTCPDPVKRKLLDAGSRDTVRTRAWTGKPARLLRTKGTDAWDDPENPDPSRCRCSSC